MSATEITARERHTTWVLARLAGCGDPDRHDGLGFETPVKANEEQEPSAGARFLRSVEDAVYEAWEEAWADRADDEDGAYVLRQVRDSGRLAEIADAAPDVYTYTRWQEFVDLAAWQEEIESGLVADEDGEVQMTDLAGVALYMIAERLAWALLEELAEEADEESENDRIPDGCNGTMDEAAPGSEISYRILHGDWETDPCPVHGAEFMIRVIDFD